MMNKKTWYVITIKDDEGKFYSFAEGINNNCDLTGYAKQAHTMNACDSKKEAQRIADEWNWQYIKNGTANKWLRPVGGITQ